MGWDLVLIATTANGLHIPAMVKCCICAKLLDDGVGLSGCDHNACYQCMKRMSSRGAKCPIDGQPFDVRRYIHLSPEAEEWLFNTKLKCQWFDGQVCQATAVSLRNAHRHSQVCRNNPDNKKSSEQIKTAEFVHNWLRANSGRAIDPNSVSLTSNATEAQGIDGISSGSSKSGNAGQQKPRSGYGFRPTKRSVGPHFFPRSMDPEFDPDWRK